MERAGPLPYVSHRSQAVVAVVHGAAATECEPPVAMVDATSAAVAWARNVRMMCFVLTYASGGDDDETAEKLLAGREGSKRQRNDFHQLYYTSLVLTVTRSSTAPPGSYRWRT